MYLIHVSSWVPAFYMSCMHQNVHFSLIESVRSKFSFCLLVKTGSVATLCSLLQTRLVVPVVPVVMVGASQVGGAGRLHQVGPGGGCVRLGRRLHHLPLGPSSGGAAADRPHHLTQRQTLSLVSDTRYITWHSARHRQ